MQRRPLQCWLRILSCCGRAAVAQQRQRRRHLISWGHVILLLCSRAERRRRGGAQCQLGVSGSAYGRRRELQDLVQELRWDRQPPTSSGHAQVRHLIACGAALAESRSCSHANAIRAGGALYGHHAGLLRGGNATTGLQAHVLLHELCVYIEDACTTQTCHAGPLQLTAELHSPCAACRPGHQPA